MLTVNPLVKKGVFTMETRAFRKMPSTKSRILGVGGIFKPRACFFRNLFLASLQGTRGLVRRLHGSADFFFSIRFPLVTLSPRAQLHSVSQPLAADKNLGQNPI